MLMIYVFEGRSKSAQIYIKLYITIQFNGKLPVFVGKKLRCSEPVSAVGSLQSAVNGQPSEVSGFPLLS
jgi:hypothetical protein